MVIGVVLLVFELLRNQLRNIFWMVPMFTQAKVSLDRVNDFLRDVSELPSMSLLDIALLADRVVG